MHLFCFDGRGRHLRTWFALLLAVLIMTPGEASAAARRASMVIDANTGKVLHASNADALRHPASLTKMMTLYLVFEGIERGRLSLKTKIKMSGHAASAPPSKLGLKVGEEIAVSDAIKALTTKSANDIAVALAEHIGGSEADFARMMTEKARLLGMSKTTFRNASGLPNVEQVTTARDMLTLALHLQDDFPQHYHFFSVKAFSYKGRIYRSHNSLLRTFSGMDGLKTGYIRMSGFNVVSSVRRGERRVVAVVFGGTTARSRNAEIRALLNRTIPKASTKKTRTPAPVAFYRATPPARAERKAPIPAQQSPAPAVMTASMTPKLAAPARAAPAPVQSSSWSGPSISIAKVRPVMVLPPPKQEQELTPAPQPIAVSQAKPQLVGTGIAFAAPGLQPSTLQAQAQNLAQGRAPLQRVAVAGAAAQEIEKPQLPVTMAAADQPVEQPPAIPQIAATAPSAKPAATGGYQIQVGAYASAAEAEKALVATLERAAGVLSSAAPVTAAVQNGSRQLYRARFAGFNSQAATNACQELRKRQIECFVAKAE